MCPRRANYFVIVCVYAVCPRSIELAVARTLITRSLVGFGLREPVPMPVVLVHRGAGGLAMVVGFRKALLLLLTLWFGPVC